MVVRELIAWLQRCNQEADIALYVDGNTYPVGNVDTEQQLPEPAGYNLVCLVAQDITLPVLKPQSTNLPCAKCKGTGMVLRTSRYFPGKHRVACSQCAGTGLVDNTDEDGRLLVAQRA